MKTFSRLVGLLTVLAFASAGTAAAKPKTPPDVLIVADVLAKDSATSLRPEPGRPIYYIILGKMERDLGSPYGGMKSPDPAAVQKELTAALASQGFLETKVGGPKPSLALIVSWGQANLSTQEVTESVDSTDSATGTTTTENVTSNIAFNVSEIAQLVGADKAARRLVSNQEASEINENLNSDRLYIFVGALDADALRKKQKKIMWRTRISIDSRREELDDNLRLMISAAAPYFGRGEDLPITITEENRRAGVKLGELKVVGETPPAKPDTAPKK